MIKKIALCILCFMLGISVLVSAKEEVSDFDTVTQEPSQEQPLTQRQGPGGERPEMPPNSNENQGGTNQEEQNGENTMPQFGGRGGMGDRGRPNGGMSGFNGEMPQDFQNPMQSSQQTASDNILELLFTTYQTPTISVILLIFAFAFIIFYKRKRY